MNLSTPTEQAGNLSLPKRGRGRPPGAPTRVATKGETRLLAQRIQKIYEIIEHMLTPEQQEFYKRAFSGKEKYDPMKHAEFFTLLYSVYANDILLEAIDSQTVSQDIAQTLREYRMALKELDDMKRAREKELAKDDERLIDPTKQPAKSRVDSLIERASQEG